MLMSSAHRQFLAAPAALLLAGVLAACGSSSASTTTSSSSAPAPAASGSTASAPQGKVVKVTLKNYSVTLAGGDHLSPGTYTFEVTNASGGTGHNLTISGPGVANMATPTFTSGTKRLTVTLKNGRYTFFCSIHKSFGMTTPVTVGSGGGSSGTTTPPASSGGSSSSGGSWS
jgi:plastocyanin